MVNRGEILFWVRSGAMRRAAGAGLGLGIFVASVAVFGDESAADRYFFAPSYEAVSAEKRLAAKVDPSRDAFASETIGERIALKFDELSLELKQSPANTDSVAKMLADGFRAVGWGGREVAVRTEPPLLLYRRVDPPAEEIDRERFLAEFRSLTAAYRQIETAEFEVVGIAVDSDRDPARVETEDPLRYGRPRRRRRIAKDPADRRMGLGLDSDAATAMARSSLEGRKTDSGRRLARVVRRCQRAGARRQ